MGLKIGLIGERQADLYVHLSDKTGAWDACAPDAILRAAGGTFSDLSGRPMHYAGRTLDRTGIVASNRKAYDAVMPVVLELAKAAGLVA